MLSLREICPTRVKMINWHVQDKEVVSYVQVEYVYTSVDALTSMRDVCCFEDKILDDN